jgi:hypothetical protein
MEKNLTLYTYLITTAILELYITTDKIQADMNGSEISDAIKTDKYVPNIAIFISV